jgi:Na+-driven multidrug efflux pump
MSLTRMFVLYVPLALLLEWPLGYSGIFLAACLTNLAMGATGYLWNRRTFVRKVSRSR